MKKIVPLLLPILGTTAGIAVSALLNDPDDPGDINASQSMELSAPASPGKAPVETTSYVKLNNQFIVPVIDKDKVASIIVLSLSLEITGNSPAELVYAKEPKLRDVFLQVLFDHSNIGGFHGAFSDASKIEALRRSLLTVAKMTLGEGVQAVLITNLARQDA